MTNHSRTKDVQDNDVIAPSRLRQILSLIFWIALFEGVSWLIGMATQGQAETWYATLAKPPLNPPDIAFPITWGILYVMIATAGWYLWMRRSNEDIRPLFLIFLIYTGFNWAYMFIFFGAHMLLASLLWIIALNSLAVLLIIKSWPVARPAAYLMIPPTLWTLFATYLNAGIWWLN